jgi:NADPH:quinone reductase-like Zn-dependent oxidoreductase
VRASGPETPCSSGGVGAAAVQLAKRRGAMVIALTAGTKAAQVERLGASRVLPRDANLQVHDFDRDRLRVAAAERDESRVRVPQ